MEIVAAELRAELARRRWTHAELARRVGCSRSLIGFVCAGMVPSAKLRDRILAAFGGEASERICGGREKVGC